MICQEKHTLVVGATGVIGGAVAKRLVANGGLVTLAARPRGKDVPGVLGVDLLEQGSRDAAAKSLRPVTHLFFAAYQSRPDRIAEIEPNLNMLKGAVELAERGGALQRVVLMTGGKYYGVQWGQVKTPARETDPRHLGPNFYYDQQDFLEEAAKGKSWTWTNLIPPMVTGFAERSPMNLVMAVGVLATLAKMQGRALQFPGPAAAWNSLHHLADAEQIAAAAAWAADSENAANQIFNVTNGDPGRWRYLWRAVADDFDLAVSEPLHLPLGVLAEASKDAWRRIAVDQGLREHDIQALVDWRWAEYMFTTAFAHDVLLETGKIRRAGFHGCVDSEAMLLQRIHELQDRKLLPKF